jgi:hypothetical protein
LQPFFRGYHQVTFLISFNPNPPHVNVGLSQANNAATVLVEYTPDIHVGILPIWIVIILFQAFSVKIKNNETTIHNLPYLYFIVTLH